MLLDRVATANRLGVHPDTVTLYRRLGRLVPVRLEGQRSYYDSADVAAVIRRWKRLRERFGRYVNQVPVACWRDDAALDAYLDAHRQPEPERAIPHGYLTATDITERLHVTRQCVLEWIKTGRLPAIRFPQPRQSLPKWGVAVADFEVFEREWRPGAVTRRVRESGHFMTFEIAQSIRAFVAERKRAGSRRAGPEAAERFGFSVSVVSFVRNGHIWTTPDGPTNKDYLIARAKRRRQRNANPAASRRAAA